MKNPLGLFFVLCFCELGLAQVSERTVADSLGKNCPKKWTLTGKQHVLFGQTSFSNWAAGGDNSAAVSARTDYRLDYRKEKHRWDNELILAYGLRKAGDEGKRKTDDELHFLLKYNCRYSQNWSVGGALDFQTQFDKGYDYDVSDTDYLSKFMAPGYLTTGPAIDYSPSDDFYVSLRPAALKFNFVLDDKLSDRGDYGVDPGKAVFTQLGGDTSIHTTAWSC